MVDVTIDDLVDIGTTQAPDANTIIQQTGVSFKARTRPNPPLVINVSSEAQLVSSLGSELIIPDNVDLTVNIDASFTLNLPFKLGNSSGFELRTSKIGPQLSYTGPGALIQKNLPTDEAAFVFLEDLNIVGDGTNSLIDIVMEQFGFAVFTGVFISSFGSIGEISVPTFVVTRFTGFSLAQGMVIRNGVSVRIDNVIFSNFSPSNTTWFSILDSIPIIISLRDMDVSNFAPGDSLFFLDPNAVAGSSFIINGSRIVGGGNFYQQGVNTSIAVVVDNVPNALFVTAGTHGFVVGTPIVISGFVTNPTYNGTFIITAATLNTFETGVAFGSSETVGSVNGASLDQTDIRVCSQANSASPNSQAIGGWAHTTNVTPTTVVDGTFGPLDLSTAGGVTPFVENERFILENAIEGVLQYIGIQAITVTLIGVLSITKTGTTRTYNLRYAIDHEEIDTVAVVLGGTGYTNGEFVTLTGQTSGAFNATAQIFVTAGVIDTMTIISGGSGYTNGETVDVIGGTGSGATGTATTFGFVALPTSVERTQDISTTSRDSTLNQQVIVDTNDKIRIEIEGVGTADDITVVFGSLDIA